MDLLLAFGVAVVLGIVAGGLVQLRFKNTVFIRIRSHVALGVFILFLSFFLFGLYGKNIWGMMIIPVFCLIIVLVIIRNGISKLLEI